MLSRLVKQVIYFFTIGFLGQMHTYLFLLQHNIYITLNLNYFDIVLFFKLTVS